MVKFLLPLLFLPLLLLGCSKSVTLEEATGIQKVQQAMPVGGKFVDPVHGEEVWLAIGALSGIERTPANGVAQAHFFADGTFGLTLQLNIEPAKDGYFYEGWLKNGTKMPLSTGHLSNTLGDVRHFLVFFIEEDLRSSLDVTVSLEADDGNPSQGIVVAKGTMKVTARPEVKVR